MLTSRRRFDEFVAASGLTVLAAEQFPGFLIEVALPPDWMPFGSEPGLRVWVCRSDPRIAEFGANAVLTTNRVESPLDPDDTFAMLCEQQAQSVAGAHEHHRDLADAAEGPGVLGTLALQIDDPRGLIDSVSRTRIITTGEETLIAQLTVTALHESPVDRAHLRLTVQEKRPAGPQGGAPVSPNPP